MPILADTMNDEAAFQEAKRKMVGLRGKATARVAELDKSQLDDLIRSLGNFGAMADGTDIERHRMIFELATFGLAVAAFEIASFNRAANGGN